jgi:eukaryotic-like serine/threonine-protein kinase
MTPERWLQLKEIFQSALERNPAERSAFLRHACAGDAALRSEVESLIDSHDQAGDSIEAMAVEAATEMLSADQTGSVLGKHIGHYQVMSHIGRGGMGEVFLAQDTSLGRKVALKLLRSDFTRNEDRLSRFRQEARAASALNHPNILTIHEIGQADTLHFMAMEYVEGETLRQHISRARMTLGQVLDVTVQVASALAAAHQAGIVHRDIKPENIMLRTDGYVKVLDFGLAKLAESKVIDTAVATLPKVETEPGVVMGTVSYMSPEQARGLAVDARTDIWSLGVMIYEMAAGRQPFEGETASDVMSLILQKEPPSLTLSLPEVPGELERIVRKALRKDKEERYQTIKDLLIDLRNLRKELELEAEMERSATPMVGHPTSAQSAAATAHSMSSAEYIVTEIKQHKRTAALIIGMVIVSAILLLSLLFRQSSSTKEASPRNTSLAVLPFKPIGAEGEDEYLGLGMADALITKLSNIRGINVRPTSAVRKYGAQNQDPMAAARELGVEAVVEGSVQKVGEQVRVTVQLVSVRDGTPLWGQKFDEQFTNIFAVQDQISEQVARALTLSLSGAEQELLTKRYTENSEAYQLYLKGRFFWNKRTVEGLKKGLSYFNAAVEKDPSYAVAYVGLADSYSLLSDYGGLPPKEAYPQAKRAAMQALALDERLAEAHAALGSIKAAYDWDWTGAESEYRRAIELNPNYETAHQWYAEYLSGMGRHQEAITEIRRAREINPLSLIINAVEVSVLCIAREYDQGISQSQKALEMDPHFAEVYGYLKRCYDQKGMYKEAIAAHQMQRKLAGHDAEETAALREAAAATSPRVYWQKRLEQELEESKRELSAGFEMAEIFAQLGKKDQAFAWLERAYKERSFMMLYLKVAPNLDPLRSDPRFADLLRRVGHTP